MKKGIRSVILLLAILLSLVLLSSCGEQGKNSYDISVELNTESMEYTAVQKTTYIHRSELPTSEVCFNLYQNTTRKQATHPAVPKDMESKAYPNGKSYGEIVFSQIKTNGETALFDVCGKDKNFLKISLKSPLENGDSVTVEMSYKVKLANINSRLGYGKNTINLGNFYPILAVYREGEFYECVPYSNGDPFFSEMANYKVDITLPKKFLVASAGEQREKVASETHKTIEISEKNIRSFAMVCSEKFICQQQIQDGITINYYHISDKTPTETTSMIATEIEQFQKDFGKYNHKTYAVCDADFFQGGMEYSGMTMISTQTSEDFRRSVIVHETAHQWWQNMVGVNEITLPIIDEGLAEYSTSYFFSLHPEYGVDANGTIANKKKAYETYCEILRILGEKTPPDPSRSLGEYQSGYDYFSLVYVQGHLIFQSLEEAEGREAMLNFLQEIQRKYNGEIIEEENILEIATNHFAKETVERLKTMLQFNQK